MTDEPGFIHIALSTFTPQEHAPDCTAGDDNLHIGFGLAGGGFGSYGCCPECWAVRWKTEDHSA